ncbi:MULTISPECIES: c-type cytochrome [Psychroflexus]|uniref:Cytochrome C oxidase, cbb3-type, subunit III n=1 Tax=Psychroflexus halocasei TaxID=908615 RepID=A0A1H4CX45_9FLAO|nr:MULTISPECIES: c-type cytochrome [Psychroflexus]PJX22694.1 cytochrome C [Psychroflexus sp. S27]SEA65025.1 Cytochrome C oxidase, cbb3-type, subunit III [Psychroflexus halocasei]
MNKFNFILLAMFAFTIFSCADEDGKGAQYFPNMMYSDAYETYGEYEIFYEGQEAKLPVEGSISRGWMPYEYEDNLDGYDAAKAELRNPIAYTEDNMQKGTELFNIYCAVCHGAGDGKGILVKNEKILGVPAFDDQGRAITEGSVYHVTKYGLNTMGSYASQLSQKEMWQVNMYVMKLKGDLDGVEQPPFENEQ